MVQRTGIWPRSITTTENMCEWFSGIAANNLFMSIIVSSQPCWVCVMLLCVKARASSLSPASDPVALLHTLFSSISALDPFEIALTLQVDALSCRRNFEVRRPFFLTPRCQVQMAIFFQHIWFWRRPNGLGQSKSTNPTRC